MGATEQKLISLLDGIKNRTREQRFTYSFRGSSLPYCQVKDFLTVLIKPDVNYGILREFYFEVGSAVHSLLQRWLAEEKDEVTLYGDWTCTRCGKEKEKLCGPQYCCDRLMLYKEVEIDIPGYDFKGHCDGLLSEGDTFTLLEMKTCKEIPAEIPIVYRFQVSAYRYVLETFYHLKMNKKVAFLYIPREGFHLAKWIFYEPEFVDDFKLMVKRKKGLDVLLKTGNIDKLNGVCSAPSDAKDCPYAALCFSPMRDTLIKHVWEKRDE